MGFYNSIDDAIQPLKVQGAEFTDYEIMSAGAAKAEDSPLLNQKAWGQFRFCSQQCTS